MENKIHMVEGRHGRVFTVGEKLPDDIYEIHEGRTAIIVNDFIPSGVFILIRKHTIVEILDMRDSEDSTLIQIDLRKTGLDAIGLCEHDFEQNSHQLTATLH